MRGMVGRFRHWSGLAPAALALLLLLRLLIPSGYMIAPDHEGRPGLALCAAPAQPAADSEPHRGHEGHPAEHPAPSKPGEIPCPFAALAAPPLPPEPPAVAPRVSLEAVPQDLPVRADPPLVASAAPPPPPTGPPLPV